MYTPKKIKVGDVVLNHYASENNPHRKSIVVQLSSRHKYISSEPISYPCIFIWTCIDGDNPEYRGEFIYPQDFEYMKRYGD